MPEPPEHITEADFEALGNFGFELPGRGWVHAKQHEIFRNVPIDICQYLQQAGRAFVFACGADQKKKPGRPKQSAA